VVICLERGADLHMAQLMPLPLTVSCFSKIQIGFTIVVPAHPGSPGKRAVKRECVCVCVRVRVRLRVCVFVCLRSCLRNYTSDLHQIFCACYLGSVLFWRRSDTLRISGFVNDVIVAHKVKLLEVSVRLRQ